MSRWHASLLILLAMTCLLLLDLPSRLSPSRARRTAISRRPPPIRLKEDRCAQAQKIGFCKTHKTASSSVQNIVLRYSYFAKLNLVLTSGLNNHLADPKDAYSLTKPFHVEWAEQLPWHAHFVRENMYDVVALHSKWNHSAFSALLGSNAVYFTILRNPSDAFESLYSYTNLTGWFNKSIHQYIASLPSNSTLASSRSRGYLGLNQQSWDLGASAEQLLTSEAETDFEVEADLEANLEAFVSSVDANFHLVMLAERFEESVVLLADLLCLPIANMTSLQMNSRKKENKLTLNSTELSILRRFQRWDERLYSHFSAVFEERLRAFGAAKMAAAVADLRRMNDLVVEQCVDGVTDKTGVKGSYLEPFSADTVVYKIKAKTVPCMLHAISENNLVSHLIKRQTQRWDHLTSTKGIH